MRAVRFGRKGATLFMNPNVPFAPDPEGAWEADGPVRGLGDDDVGRVNRLSAAIAVFL